MHPFEVIFRDIRRFFHKRQIVVMDPDAIKSLQRLSEANQLPPERTLKNLLEEAIQAKEIEASVICRWQNLSEKEKCVTALICAGYSTDEIAERMGIASSTVKTHIKKIFIKCQVHDRARLREILAAYDLSAYE